MWTRFWSSLWSFTVWTYATAELLLPVVSSVLLQLEKTSFLIVTQMLPPRCFFPPCFFSTIEESSGCSDTVRCFRGPNVRQLWCCVLLFFIDIIKELKGLLKIKMWNQYVEYCFNECCALHQQQTVVKLPVLWSSTDSINLMFCLLSPPEGTVTVLRGHIFSAFVLLCLKYVSGILLRQPLCSID